MNINSQSETITPCIAKSSENLTTSNRDEIAIDIPEIETKSECRICHSSSESLITPCECKGTIEHVHLHCLETWLEAKNIDYCDLCQYQFQTKRTRKSLPEILRDREMRKYILIYCTFMAVVISPFITASWMFWISAEAFVKYIQNYGWNIYAATTFFLPFGIGVGVIACFTMIIMVTRDFIQEVRDWQNRNWNIRIVDRSPSDATTNSNIKTCMNIPSDTRHDLTSVTEQPVIRYKQDVDGADYVAIIGITPSENDTNRKESDGRTGLGGEIV